MEAKFASILTKESIIILNIKYNILKIYILLYYKYKLAIYKQYTKGYIFTK